MLRSQLLKFSKRFMATATQDSKKELEEITKSWASNSKSDSFKIKYQQSRRAVLNGVGPYGPPSLRSRRAKLQYMSPLGLDEAFDSAYEILKTKSNETYKEIEELDTKISQTKNVNELEELNNLKNSKLVQAEIDNPEVRFNFTYHDKINNDSSIIDYNEPVYRELKKKHWEDYSQMLLMQRLEQLGAIPDTLPTLNPRAEILVKFLNHTTINRWIEPGKLLPTNATSYPPSFKIQEYENVDPKKQLYTVLVVNPDVPDLENDSFKTYLHWGLSNIKLSNFNENFIGPKQILENKEINEIIDYLPPVPEKNIPTQRFITWVFRQPESISINLKNRDFDIRSFVEDHGLDAIGGHIWRSEWDSSVAKVRELYGLPKGTVYHRVRK
ncbi:54S ribosomal protein L35, mitochondrial [Wickerhamomyces ciferrii]|uniref:Large ribosomal subunit protein mL38 n=1 Tax=Wickerhamomyces ciferrii (strain ATCC 14091 / BCRC 22168 / CBS 111 / JCM 3599 / NBRC 0793 / NRRL Y-1031 F-60-10) TaxID=1206466 RepID=K0KJ32_WICCF|nr:54S ribosomal protein L35, mitochondrial [Wickerhamomyces ciferrii]CCH42147.1 54S ribosomal protein L35, mitochondrial [Wickerhamomyces ciferrii]